MMPMQSQLWITLLTMVIASVLLIIIGFVAFFGSDLYRAFRELTINSRGGQAGEDYENMNKAAVFSKVMGVLLMVIGGIMGINIFSIFSRFL